MGAEREAVRRELVIALACPTAAYRGAARVVAARMVAARMVLAALAVVAVLAGCRSRGDSSTGSSGGSGSGPGAGSALAPRTARVANPAAAGSTIARADYIGPDACGECHAEQLAQWTMSLHPVMNQRAESGGVIGAFGGTVLRYAGGEARFDGDAKAGYTMTLTHGERRVSYRVTRTIGVRSLQEYVGIEQGRDAETYGEEVRLPFGWWPKRAGWYPQPYFDPWLPEDKVDVYAPVREPWAERCPWCHSTYAFEQRIARAALKPVGHGLEQQFVGTLGSETLAIDQQVTIGISCESCHLGGRAHAAGAPIHLVPQGAEPRPGAVVPTTFAQERTTPAIVNTVCAQCHSGPSPRLADGTALRNSSEAIDLAASSCTTARCIDCHDPHRGGFDEKRAIAACTKCHSALADPSSARTHAGHAPATTCLDCHMPKVVMGIDRFVRTHRISSPTNAKVLATAGPNACNLCHLDRSIAWTVAELRAQFEVRLDPQSWKSYGDPESSVGDVWLTSGEPAFRIMAAAAYARSPLGSFAVLELVRGLGDPLAHVRTWTLLALEELLHRRITDAEYDPRAPSADRARQVQQLTERLRPRPLR